MATVNVTSWAEFVAAVSVAGDTVVCPADAVWDLSEAEPITEPIEIACSEIQGNGTTIKNLSFAISRTLEQGLVYAVKNTNELQISDLRFDSVIFRDTVTYYHGAVFWCSAYITNYETQFRKLKMNKVSFSGIVVNPVEYCFYGFCYFTSCAMDVSCQNGGNLIYGNNPDYGKSKFCRYRFFTTSQVSPPFMYDISPFNFCEKCELILSAPNASGAAFELDSGTFKTSGCVIRGTTGATQEYNLASWDLGYHNWLNVASTSLGCKVTMICYTDRAVDKHPKI